MSNSMASTRANAPAAEPVDLSIAPRDEQRPASAALLARAWAAGEAAGITRLADVTRLDRIGLPVWQAVRPMSRALSVHQGKGASHDDARLGAMLEAIESQAAEQFDAPGPECCWRDLPQKERLADLGDVACDRASPPDPALPIRWIDAERLDGRRLYLPLVSVSLDFTRDLGTRFERASAGLATGVSEEDARRAALLELVERDALARFRLLDDEERLGCEIMPSGIDFDWFTALQDRLSERAIRLRLFHFPAPSGVPVIAASLSDGAKRAAPYAATVGHAAHPDPAIALFQALAEALQSRLTFIAGARDDCWPWLYTDPSRGILSAFAPPRPPGMGRTSFDAIAPCAARFSTIAGAVEAAHREVPAFLPIARPEGFHVVRAFVPGMGSMVKDPR
ncbi:YcaO-like family protein [Sphingomicrobium arenosum]|uniref:YcaO-like family protein n=1 Tax=Sphingomicrobium arenosum TaxID=2233861 RepID=UPI00223FCC8B|nr:YcaO-like family protein [Sphingomicrobium arenosum]